MNFIGGDKGMKLGKTNDIIPGVRGEIHPMPLDDANIARMLSITTSGAVNDTGVGSADQFAIGDMVMATVGRNKVATVGQHWWVNTGQHRRMRRGAASSRPRVREAPMARECMVVGVWSWVRRRP